MPSCAGVGEGLPGSSSLGAADLDCAMLTGLTLAFAHASAKLGKTNGSLPQ
jgi:hypothetical protein